MRRGGSDRFVVAIGRGALVPAADEMALAPAMQAAMLNGGPPRGLLSGCYKGKTRVGGVCMYAVEKLEGTCGANLGWGRAP